MFRSTKRKKPTKRPRVITSHDDDDDEDEKQQQGDGNEKDGEVSAVIQARKKAKKPRKRVGVIRSFAVEDDDDDDDDDDAPGRRRKKKKKKKTTIRGLGFGGAPVSSTTVEDEKDGEDTASYGAKALEALKAEQHVFQRNRDDQNEMPKKGKIDVAVPPSGQQEGNKDSTKALPAFIPLETDESTHPTILTGEDAMDFDNNKTSDRLPEEQQVNKEEEEEDKKVLLDDTPEASAWEAEISRRAGVSVEEETGWNKESKAEDSVVHKSLSQLHQQVQDTIVQLKTHQEDVENSFNRRQVEVNHATAELQRHEAELKQAGTAIEFYQELRVELTSWVGALRELRTRVTPIQETLRQLEQEHLDRWEWWENDTIRVLRKSGHLDSVLGRQPPHVEEEETVRVDEFGRDVKSQHVLEMEKRNKQRRKIMEERRIRGDESDAHVTKAEINDLKERRVALNEALDVALNELSDKYSSLENLVALFDKWFVQFPEEYKQCYAGMSLSDLASVLMQVRLCTSHHPLHWENPVSDKDGFPGASELRTMSRMEESVEETPLYRMVDKVLMPAIEDVLQQKAYNLVSTKHTRSMAAFYRHTTNLLPKSSVLIDKLKAQLVSYFRERLESLAIPITRGASALSADNVSSDVRDALEYAHRGQLYRIEGMVANLLTHWVPLLGGSDNNDGALCQVLLDFISSQFLFLLSSLRDETSKLEAGRVFGNIWTHLQKTGWLERPGNMLQAAPIRAAATVYCPSNKDDD